MALLRTNNASELINSSFSDPFSLACDCEEVSRNEIDCCGTIAFVETEGGCVDVGVQRVLPGNKGKMLCQI